MSSTYPEDHLLAAMQVESPPDFSSVLVHELEKVLRAHIDKAVQLEIGAAKIRLEEQLRDIVAQVSMKLFNKISFESRGHEFVLKVNIDDRR